LVGTQIIEYKNLKNLFNKGFLSELRELDDVRT